MHYVGQPTSVPPRMPIPPSLCVLPRRPQQSNNIRTRTLRTRYFCCNTTKVCRVSTRLGHTYEVSTPPPAIQYPRPFLPFVFGRRVRPKALRSICLWDGWESLEPRVASAIVGEVSSGSGPEPQSPYETRLTGEVKGGKVNHDACRHPRFVGTVTGSICRREGGCMSGLRERWV